MGRRRKPFVALLVSAVLVGLLFVSGCTEGPPKGAVEAGYKEVGWGGAEVVGYLGYSELEGGFWAVYSSPISTSSVDQPTVLAVLLPGSVDEAGISALKDRYVWAAGRVSKGGSIRMAGPEIKVDGIDTVMEP